jgi:hypothetical protein
MKYFPDVGPRGGSALSIRFVDPKTSRVVREEEIFSVDDSFADDTTRAELQTQVRTSVATVQRILDTRRFRTLIALGDSRSDQQPNPNQIHAEFADDRVRIIDPRTASVLWQERFGTPSSSDPSGDAMCGSWNLDQVTAWWDPPTKHVIAELIYRTGGCMCTNESVVQVRRMP